MVLTSILVKNTFLKHFKTLNKPIITTRHLHEETKKVDIKGQTVNYLKIGQGPINLLCFPGALGTIWSDFKPQIEGFSREDFTTFAWDPPGYGFSRPPDRKFDTGFYENDADIAAAFMKAIGVIKYSLLGWSDGGISSLILASKYPENIDKLVVWGANAFVDSKDIESYNKIRDLSKWSDKMKEPLIKLYTEKGLQNMWNDWCNTMDQIYASGGDICKTTLKNIKCPTLVLHGDKDPLVPLHHPLFLQESIKGSL